jgi:hypothetical protein
VLAGMLADWDGELTILLRKRLHRHIGRCAACSMRRDLELHPVRLLDLSPRAAMAAAAADSLRVATGPPTDLRAQTLALATGQDPGAIAHRSALLDRAGEFDSHGFPKPVPGLKWAPAPRVLLRSGSGDWGGEGGATGAGSPEDGWGGEGGTADGDRAGRRKGQVAVAGVVGAALIGAVTFALVDGFGHTKLAGGQLPPTGTTAAAPSGTTPSASSSSPTPSPTGTAATTATATPKTTGSATTAPRGTPTGASRATTSAAPSSSTAAPSSSTAGPTATGTARAPAPSPTAKAAPGTLAVSPSGGTLVVPPGGATISLTAQGGPVTWSSTVSLGLGSVHLSPSGGTIAAGAGVTVTVTSSGASSGQQVTINPGGTVFTVLLSLARRA